MISYLLDSSVIIDYLRGKKEVVNLLDNLEGILTSSVICLAELYEGVHRVKNSQTLENQVDTFFSSLSHLYEIDIKVGKSFGEIRAKLKLSGEVIEDLDILIGATCLVHELTLLTKNRKHFSHIPNLKIYTF